MTEEAVDYTNVVQAYKKFVDNFNKVIIDTELLGVEPWMSLLEEAQGIDELLNDPVISEELDNYKLEKIHPVRRLGVEDIVLSLYERDMKSGEISTELGTRGIQLSANDITSYLKTYASNTIIDKAEFQYGSVFDTQTQLQRVFEYLEDLLEQIQISTDRLDFGKSGRFEIQRGVVAEIRQTLKDAAELSASVANLQNMEEFKKAVLGEIRKCEPLVQQRIFRALRQLKQSYRSLDI